MRIPCSRSDLYTFSILSPHIPHGRTSQPHAQNSTLRKKASCKIRPYTSKSSLIPWRSSYLLLKAGALTAHEVYRLMLLGSPPDMVHSSSLRKTHSSTQQNTTQFRETRPSSEESTPAVADFRYRVPLIPRLVWPYFTACTVSDTA